MKTLYVVFTWIYGIAVVAIIGGFIAMQVISYLGDALPFYHYIMHLDHEGIIIENLGDDIGGVLGTILSGIVILVSFFIFYIPVIFILLYPMIWLNEKLNIDTGMGNKTK